MSLQVYFNNILIDEQYYTGLSNNYELFNESFKLGATPSNKYTLKIAKEGVNEQPTTIKLYDNAILFADLEIDNIEKQDYEYVYTLTDKMIDLEFNYDASQIFENGHTTLYDIATDICDRVGLSLGTPYFRGYDKQITWYDNTRTAREYIGFIAELNGGFARIINNVLYFIKQKTNVSETINIADCEDFKIGERHKITRVVYEMGTIKYEFGDETGNTLYLNPDNVYITSENDVEEIYNDIKNLEFYSFSTSNCPINYDIKAGDIISFTDEENNYPTIAQYDLEYAGGWIGGYDLDINTERQEETQIIGDKQNIKNLRIVVDRNTNSVSQVIEEMGQQNQKIANVTQTVEELNSKISDIADITTSQETNTGRLTFTDINQSEPIRIEIHPISESITKIYPMNAYTGADGIFPSNSLYPKGRLLRFTNTTTNEVFDYELPADLLYYNGVYDEFILDYDGQSCVVNKKISRDDYNELSVITTQTIEYDFPHIGLTDGDYTVEIVGYNQAYLFVRLMVQYIYTTEFATNAKLNSEISQTASSITSMVSETYATKTTTNSLSSRINQTAKSINLSTSDNNTSAGITIRLVNEDGTIIDNKSANITMSGLVSFTDLSNAGRTTINGANITTGSIDASRVNVVNLNASNITSGTISGDTINGGTINGNNVSITNLDASNITAGTFSANRISGGTISASTISLRNTTLGTTSSRIGGFAVNSNNLTASTNNGNIGMSQDRSGNPAFFIEDGDLYTTINKYGGFTSGGFYGGSLEKWKKNFEKFSNALEIIKNIDIYKYNLRTEKDTEKKHIGFVIGNNYNYAKEVTSNNNENVDLYSFISLCCQAIKEQQEKIEELEKRLEEK